MFETAAIILYLVQRFDPEFKLSFPAQSDDESEALQWIAFGVSELLRYFTFRAELLAQILMSLFFLCSMEVCPCAPHFMNERQC